MSVQTSVQKVLRATSANDAVTSGLRLLSSRGLLWNGIWRRLPVERRFQVGVDRQDCIEYSSVAEDSIGRSLFWRGLDAWEGESLRVFYTACKSAVPAGLVIDVGANTGIYTLLACLANPNLRVLAFEPVPKIFRRLTENISINGYTSRCTAYNSAVSDYVGAGSLHVPNSNLPSSASFHPDGFRGVEGDRVEVSVTTLDDVVDPSYRVEVVKMDVEGFEDRVLRGMGRILAESRPSMIVECSPDGPFREVESILQDFRYVFYHLLPSGPELRRKIEPDVSERYRNYLMVPSELPH